MPRAAHKKHSRNNGQSKLTYSKDILLEENLERVDSLFPGAFDAATIPAKLLASCSKYPDKIALLYKMDHVFSYVQYKRLLNLVENFTLSLERLGVKKGDRVAIMSENRPEWAVTDLSVKSLGSILVPLHKTFTSEQTQDILREIEPSLLIASDTSAFKKLKQARSSYNKSIPLIFLDGSGRNNGFPEDNIQDFISALQLVPHEDHSKFYEKKVSEISASEVATILYTPSSNCRYLGVQLTHGNIVSNIISTKAAVNINEHDRFLSVLPLSHALEKTAGYYVPLFSGATVSYLSDLSGLSKVMKSYKPTVIVGVPRLYEKMYQHMMREISKNKIKKHIVSLSISSSRKKHLALNPAPYVLDKLVYNKMRESLGGKVRFLISGGASLNPEIGIFFNSFGVPILEGYGLTEASPIVTVNRLDNNRFGTVGQPLPNTIIRIEEDGEILIKGPSISPGYFHNAKENKRSFHLGWFRTGDLGELDERGFLKITGKKKDIIVLSTGKNVSPNSIESRLIKSESIKQACVVGDGRKHISALIVPNLDELTRQFPDNDHGELLKNNRVKTFIQKEINELLADLAHYEQVKAFLLISKPFSKNDGTITPDGNLNRQAINTLYKKEIASSYNHAQTDGVF